jgi:hypothetical protein
LLDTRHLPALHSASTFEYESCFKTTIVLCNVMYQRNLAPYSFLEYNHPTLSLTIAERYAATRQVHCTMAVVGNYNCIVHFMYQRNYAPYSFQAWHHPTLHLTVADHYAATLKCIVQWMSATSRRCNYITICCKICRPISKSLTIVYLFAETIMINTISYHKNQG